MAAELYHLESLARRTKDQQFFRHEAVWVPHDNPLDGFPWPFRTHIHNSFSVKIAGEQLAVDVTGLCRAAIMIDMTVPLAELAAGCHGAPDELERLNSLAFGTLDNDIDWLGRKTNFAGDPLPREHWRCVP